MDDVVSRPRNGLSLCAGAGGLDMGLMLAEPDFHTRCFVEWEAYPRAAIIAAQRAGYFAPAPIWDDVKTFDGKPLKGAIDTILAGYPCQPFSQAGNRLGTDDSRHLWPHIARIIREIEPRWVFLENVAGHISLGAEAVLRELHNMGFTSAAGAFSAAEIGAPHERLRWFCVAYRDSQDWQSDSRDWQSDSREPVGWADGRDQSIRSSGEKLGNAKRAADELRRKYDNISETSRKASVRNKSWSAKSELADTARPNGERDRRQPARRAGYPDSGRDLAYASNEGLQGVSRRGDEVTPLSQNEPATGRGGVGVFPPGPADATAWATIMQDAPDLAPAVSVGDVKRACDHFATLVEQGSMAEEEVEPILCRMATGMASRSRALKLLGNGVIPLQASLAWVTLAGAHGLERLQ